MEWRNFEPLFPPEFISFEEPVRRAQQAISEIDDLLAQIPEPKGPRFELKPPGARDNDSFNIQRRKELIAKKEAVQTGIRKKIEQKLTDVDPQKAKHLRETLEVHIGDNRFKGMDRSELKDVRGSNKDPHLSSDFMIKTLSDERAYLKYGEEDPNRSAAKRYFETYSSHDNIHELNPYSDIAEPEVRDDPSIEDPNLE